MLIGPDWNKLYSQGNCLYFGVPFSDEQRDALNNAKSETERDELVRTYREEYMKNRDMVTGELIKTPEIEEGVKEEDSIEDVKPAKKKGK